VIAGFGSHAAFVDWFPGLPNPLLRPVRWTLRIIHRFEIQNIQNPKSDRPDDISAVDLPTNT
jgi:hypothetical protein